MNNASRSRGGIDWIVAAMGLAGALILAQREVAQATDGDPVPTAAQDGAALYRAACAACHGGDGTSALPSQIGFDVQPPDFTDCNFSSREPAADWFGIAHDGGPVRGFSEIMPAFGDALTPVQIEATLDHIYSLCDDDSWPRGEFNLPRPLFTEKAFPEDELVITTGVSFEDAGAVSTELLYEQRFGTQNQIEVGVPLELKGMGETPGGRWTGGVGDLFIGYKRTLFHSPDIGSIVSVLGEVVVPIDDGDDGFGAGTPKLEAFLTYGQLLPWDAFFQLQGGIELPWDPERAEREVLLRGALGKTFTQGAFGRAWSPMVEVLSKQELGHELAPEWAVAPQLHLSLNTRQHVMLVVGAHVPISDFEPRKTQVLVCLLWDWFDGGFFEGW